MNQSREQEWKSLFPIACRDVDCGIAHPRGWDVLVKRIAALVELQAQMELSSEIPLEKCARITQTKIKWMELRIYLNTHTYKWIEEAISAVTIEVHSICAECGGHNQYNDSKGWEQLICHQCKTEKRLLNRLPSF